MIQTRKYQNKKPLSANYKAYYAAIIHSSDDAIYGKTLDGIITSWNTGAETIFGYKATEIINQPVSILITPESANEFPDIIKKIKAGKRIKHFETKRQRKDGTIIHVSMSVSPILDDSGKIIGAASIARDITQSKQASQYARSLIEASLDPMVTVSPKGKITDVNEATVTITGVERSKLIGTDFSNYFTDPAKAEKGYQQVLKHGFVTDYPLTIRSCDGKLTEVLYNATVYKDIYGKVLGVFAAARDVTESRQMEQKLVASETRLKEAQRLAKIGNWELNLLTHELKWSDEIYRIFGLDPKIFGATYDSFLNAIHPNDREHVSRAYEASVANHTPYRIDHRLQMKNGDIKFVHEQCETFYDQSGKPIRSIGTVQDITERKHSENKIIESEAKFRNIFDQSPVGKAIVGLDNRFISCNPALAKFLGYTESEIIGKTINDVTYPEDKELGMAEMQLVAEGKLNSASVEKRYLRKDGSFVWGQVTMSLVRDAQGNLLYWLPIVQDITERKMMEDLLRSANAYTRSLIEASLDPLVTINPEGKITDVNEATIKVTGVERSKLIGTNFSSYFTDPSKAEKGYQQVLQKGFVTDYPLTIRHQNGNLTEVLYNATVFKDSLGKTTGVFAAARDVTEMKRIQQSIAMEHRRLNEVLEMLPANVVLLSPHYRVLFTNKSFTDHFGEPKGRKCYEFLFGRDTPCKVCETHKVFADNKPRRWEWQGPDKRFYDMHVYPFTDSDGSPLVMEMGLDITESKKAEAELHELNLTLEEKVKERTSQYETVNKELESFTYSVSHDLRAPLRAINSYSQILNEDYNSSLDEDAKHILENIKYNTSKMGKLIDELLAFSRLGRKQLERTEVDMNILVQEVIDDIGNAVSHRAKITVSELPVVKGDHTLLSQVMHNLISNAIKYSSKKEEPIVEIFTIPKNNKDEKTVFVVKDNGVGFDMRFSDKLFGVFQRLHSEKEFEGIGVGLAIVKRIVNKHGGEVWGHGEENKGASFYFTLN